jgi:phosphatidylethanolamine-binding protein (PEBP) family uncharacterized protein
MEVYYDGKKIKDGDFLKVTETQVQPKIKLNMNSNDLYTLIMYDPDAVNGTYIHWLCVNITNNDIKTGNIIIPYKGPAPPIGSGKHRYIFSLYKQNQINTNIVPMNQRQIEIEYFINMLDLGKLIFESKFITENQAGGRKSRRKKIKKRKNSRKTRRS